VRGDCNDDGQNDISDAVFLLASLFQDGAAPACEDSCDINDDGDIDIGDVIHGLDGLFSGGPAPSSPYPSCGVDPTIDSIACASYAACP